MVETVNKNVKLVLDALGHPASQWKSFIDIANETNLGKETVRRIIDEAKAQIVEDQQEGGVCRYMTRRNFRRTASFSQRVVRAIRNRVR